MRIRKIVPWIFGLFFGQLCLAHQPHEFYVVIQDSICTPVVLLYDTCEHPYLYHATLHAPVCETNKCYAIDINMYWDMIGRFHHLDTLQGHPLTKLDHVPFLSQDYKKLQNILKNHESVLQYYKKDDLVHDRRVSTVDGFTGATASELKASVIEGAVYSCYTLWHIAHDAIRDSIRHTTRSLLDSTLVREMLDRHDRSINYFLIDNLDEQGFINNAQVLLTAIFEGQGYFPKYAVSKLPTAMVQDALVQKEMVLHFDSLDYFTQVTLLERLGEVTLIDAWEEKLMQDKNTNDNTKNHLIDRLLGH